MKILYLPHQYSQQRQREKKRWIYPVRLAMEATHRRNQGHLVYWDESPQAHDYDRIVTEPEGIPFNDLPIPDRILTDAFNPKYQKNGNFKYTPGTYTMAASGCWWGKCTFCVEKDQPYEVRRVSDVMCDIIKCYELGFKEVFDDSATFPDGDWLRNFCKDKINIDTGVTRLPISCNMRIGADVDFKLMKQAGFRMLLFGIESASPITLNKINKGVKYEDIVFTIKQAAEAGLAPHIAVMFGYPWESDNDSRRTLALVHYLLKKGYAKTAQASYYTVAGQQPKEEARKYVKRIYEAAYSPEFWFNKIRAIRGTADLAYLLRQIKEGIHNV